MNATIRRWSTLKIVEKIEHAAGGVVESLEVSPGDRKSVVWGP